MNDDDIFDALATAGPKETYTLIVVGHVQAGSWEEAEGAMLAGTVNMELAGASIHLAVAPKGLHLTNDYDLSAVMRSYHTELRE